MSKPDKSLEALIEKELLNVQLVERRWKNGRVTIYLNRRETKKLIYQIAQKYARHQIEEAIRELPQPLKQNQGISSDSVIYYNRALKEYRKIIAKQNG